MNPKNPENSRWWDLSAAVILLFAVLLGAMRLVATDWTDDLDIVLVIAFCGLVFGLALGQSLFTRQQVAWYAVGMGVVVVGWQLGLLSGQGVLWSERVASLMGRILISVQNLFAQRAVTDPILFLFLMSLLFWGLGLHAGYSLTRHANAWRAVLPTGLTLFIIHIHDPYWPNRTWFLASYIFLALLLLSRTHFLVNRAAWKQSRTHLPPFVGLDFLRATMIIGSLLVLLAWTAPALASGVPPIQQVWERLAEPWYEARSKMSNAFASLRATVGITQDYYGDVLPLGRGNALTDVVVFAVQAPQPPSGGIRYYWRDRIYDFWNGNTWSTSDLETRRFSPEEPALPFADLSGRWEATFTFYPTIPSFTLHTPSQPQWFSRPAQADVLFNADGTVDVYYVKGTPSPRPGETYQVRASLSDVTINQLRAAGTDYPDWIIERYLQLPPTTSERTVELAQQIVAEEIQAGRATPYDAAEAITRWLRENISYSDSVPTPPSNQDIVDWLLFDLKQGFCNYYATAEIMMLRAVGIPSRLAVGYAQGTLDPETGLFTVLQRDAHAWVEVYFPGIGWVEFEPTLNQSPLRRPIGAPLDASQENPQSTSGSVEPQDLESLLGFEEGVFNTDPVQAPEEAASAQPISLWMVIAGLAGSVVFAVAGIAWYRQRTLANLLQPSTAPTIPAKIESTLHRFGLQPPSLLRRWAHLASLPIHARAYGVINASLKRLGAAPPLHLTPSERAALLASMLAPAAEPISVLLQEYQTFMYRSNGIPPDRNSALAVYQASQTIRQQTWAFLLKKWLSRYQEPKSRDTLVDLLRQ